MGTVLPETRDRVVNRMSGGTMTCTTCSQEITDCAMKAGEKLYHENHFICCVCKTSLKTMAVYTKNEELYCEADYMSKYVPVCARCEQYITQECVKAMEKSWHPEHFQCHGCLVQFSGSMSYREKDSQPYCDSCFVCTECSTTFEGSKNFYSVEGQPVCGACAGV